MAAVMCISFLLVAIAIQSLLRSARKSGKTFKGTHVVITGGSTGIGRSLAEAFVKTGAHVTIMARTIPKLQAAVKELKTVSVDSSQKIGFISVDVTDAKGVKRAISTCDKELPITYLVTSAGQAWPGYFLEQDVKTFQKHMDLNYYGTLHAIKAVAPLMTNRREGHIVMISSAITLAAFLGYAAYAPSKFAVRALADVLRNELQPFGVKISIAYPPDTKSPGFDNENKSKPKECKSIYALSDTYESEQVADAILDGIMAGEYHIGSPDFIQNRMINSLTVGASPRQDWVLDLLLSPIWALIAEGFRMYADYQASKYASRLKKSS
uniref:3-dehydrosphinganine reductase n=1 Tax=Lotharella globosa TaxID=91324 RepID=A0A7S3YYB5_9EUKA